MTIDTRARRREAESSAPCGQASTPDAHAAPGKVALLMNLVPLPRAHVAPRALRLWILVALSLLVLAALINPLPAAAQVAPDAGQPAVWVEPDQAGGALVHLYVFHSYSCPHCREAMPFFEELAVATPWLRFHPLEITGTPANGERYVQFAEAMGEQAMYVPAIFYCGKMVSGYDNAEGVGAQVAADLSACHDDAVARFATAPTAAAAAGAPASPEASDPVPAPAPLAQSAPPAVVVAAAPLVTLPFVGEVSAASISLPTLTVVLAGLDAFNPCAFFVLMFLLSLMVHARNRGRMLLIGGVFVLFSALIYFLFMAAWLNIFLWIGELAIITAAAGAVAVLFGAINVKDYFWFKQGVTLSIPESAKPGLFARMRTLVSADSLWAMLGGTVVLAVAANSYELLCTSGFPMVYTRALTLHSLPTASFYGYLALYNLIYVLPLLAIVTLFAVRFGSHKLSEREGRVLKLLSGLMMLMLGALLIVNPAMLNNPLTALGLLLGAVAITGVIVAIDRRRHPTPGGTGKGTPTSGHRRATSHS